MLEALFGNETCEKILFYLINYQEGYARAIAQTFGFNLRRVQLQMDRLERGGILVSRTVGRVRLYRLNPRWYFYKELLNLIEKALSTLSTEEREQYFAQRLRPRRKGKALWPSHGKPASRS